MELMIRRRLFATVSIGVLADRRLYERRRWDGWHEQPQRCRIGSRRRGRHDR